MHKHVRKHEPVAQRRSLYDWGLLRNPRWKISFPWSQTLPSHQTTSTVYTGLGVEVQQHKIYNVSLSVEAKGAKVSSLALLCLAWKTSGTQLVWMETFCGFQETELSLSTFKTYRVEKECQRMWGTKLWVLRGSHFVFSMQEWFDGKWSPGGLVTYFTQVWRIKREITNHGLQWCLHQWRHHLSIPFIQLAHYPGVRFVLMDVAWREH